MSNRPMQFQPNYLELALCIDFGLLPTAFAAPKYSRTAFQIMELLDVSFGQ